MILNFFLFHPRNFDSSRPYRPPPDQISFWMSANISYSVRLFSYLWAPLLRVLTLIIEQPEPSLPRLFTLNYTVTLSSDVSPWPWSCPLRTGDKSLVLALPWRSSPWSWSLLALRLSPWNSPCKQSWYIISFLCLCQKVGYSVIPQTSLHTCNFCSRGAHFSTEWDHHASTQGKNERLAIRKLTHAEVQFCVKECKQTDWKNKRIV